MGPLPPPPALDVVAGRSPSATPPPLRPGASPPPSPRPAVPSGSRARLACARARARRPRVPSVLPLSPLLPHAVTRAPACTPLPAAAPRSRGAWDRGCGARDSVGGGVGAWAPGGRVLSCRVSCRAAVGLAVPRLAPAPVFGCDGGFVVGSEGVGVRRKGIVQSRHGQAAPRGGFDASHAGKCGNRWGLRRPGAHSPGSNARSPPPFQVPSASRRGGLKTPWGVARPPWGRGRSGPWC